jgi:hypothetical protein
MNNGIAQILQNPTLAGHMNIQVAVLCDAAADYNGKLNLLGTFDTVFTPKLPAVHPQCSIALRIVFERIEEGAHKLRLNFVNEDGKLIMPSMDAPVDIGFPGDATFVSRNFIINIQQLKLEQAGLYSIDVALDGRQLTSVPLSVKLLEQKQ